MPAKCMLQLKNWKY